MSRPLYETASPLNIAAVLEGPPWSPVIPLKRASWNRLHRIAFAVPSPPLRFLVSRKFAGKKRVCWTFCISVKVVWLSWCLNVLKSVLQASVLALFVGIIRRIARKLDMVHPLATGPVYFRVQCIFIRLNFVSRFIQNASQSRYWVKHIGFVCIAVTDSWCVLSNYVSCAFVTENSCLCTQLRSLEGESGWMSSVWWTLTGEPSRAVLRLLVVKNKEELSSAISMCWPCFKDSIAGPECNTHV